MQIRQRSRVIAAVVCAGMLVSACGSTSKNEKASKHSSTPGSSTDGGGTDTSLAPGETSDGAATGTGGSTSSGAGKAGTSTGSAGTGGGGTTGAGGNSVGGPLGPIETGLGVTATEIRVGIHATKNINAATAVVGAKTDNPEESDTARAVADYINKKAGGIAGRKVALSIHLSDTTNGTFAAQAQAACSDLTEDKKVFVAVSSSVGGNDSMAACMAQHKTPLVEVNYWPFDKAAYDRYPSLFQPSRMSPERWAAPYIDGLIDQGFLTKSAKIGLIRMDNAVFKRTSDTMKSRLTARGLALSAEAQVVTPQSVPDLGAVASQLANVVLNFRSKGITHIIFAEYNGIIPFFLTTAAESQGYRPKYGFNSLDLPMTQASQAPAAQLNGSMVVGWLPTNDVDGIDDHRGGNYALCQKIARDAGVHGSGNGPRLYMGYACDALLFLKSVLDRAKALTPAGLQAAVESLGTTFDSPFTYATRLGPGRHDGAAAVRFTVFNEGCKCYKYANSTVRSVP